MNAASLLVMGLVTGCGSSPPLERSDRPSDRSELEPDPSHQEERSRASADLSEGREAAIFAGGCFWCMEAAFDDVDGVESTTSGYTGGRVESPTYEEISSGETGHAEALRVVYDPSRVSYPRLLEIYWENVDPTQDDGQFCDRGSQYRTGIFVLDDEQRRLAEESKRRVAAELGERIFTEITGASTFWEAEPEHQDFHRRNREHYRRYAEGCGRARRLEQVWGRAPPH
jgi:peptide-methionine (S)-S-oxide reductase